MNLLSGLILAFGTVALIGYCLGATDRRRRLHAAEQLARRRGVCLRERDALIRSQAATIDVLRGEANDATGTIERQREEIALLLVDGEQQRRRATGFFERMRGRR